MITIYGLFDSDSPGAIRYVGKTSNPRARLKGHRYPSALERVSRKTLWITSVMNAGRSVEMTTLALAPTTADADALERHWIRFHRIVGDGLTNTADGGEGQASHVQGSRDRMSTTHKRLGTRPPSWLGRTHSAEALVRMRSAQKNRYPLPEKTRRNISAGVGAANAARVHSPETRAKLSAATRGVPKSPEHRARLSESVRRAKAQKCERA